MAEDQTKDSRSQPDGDNGRDLPSGDSSPDVLATAAEATSNEKAEETAKADQARSAKMGAAERKRGSSNLFAKPRNWTFYDIFQRVLLGVWLLFLYVVLIFFVVVSFSAYQFHLEVTRSKTSDGDPVNISLVLDTRDSRRGAQDQIDFAFQQIFINNTKIARNNELLTRYYARRDELYDVCKSQIEKILRLSEQTDFDFKLIRCNEDDTTIASRSEFRPNQVDSAKSMAKEYLGQVGDLQNVLNSATKERNAALSENVALYADVEKIRKQRDEVSAASKIGEISTFLNEANFFDRFRFNLLARLILPDFLIMPTDTLVLIIVISMGALGGAIQITRNFLSAEDLSNIDTYRIRYLLISTEN